MKRKFKYRPYEGTTEYPRIPPQNIRYISLPRNQVQQFKMCDGSEYRRLVGTVQTVELELYYPQADSVVLEALTSFYYEVGVDTPFTFKQQTLYKKRNPFLEPLIKDVLGASVFRFKNPPNIESKGVDRYDITINVIGWVYEPWKLGKTIDTTGLDLPPYSPKLAPRRYSGVHAGVAVKPVTSLKAEYPADWVWETEYPASDNQWSFSTGVTLSVATSYTLYAGSIEWLRISSPALPTDYNIYGDKITLALPFQSGYNRVTFTYYPDLNPLPKPAMFFLLRPSNNPASDEYGIFPNLVPSFIQDIQLSDFGVVETQDDRLIDEKRIKSFAPLNTGLSLEFNALTSENLETLFNFYKESQGSMRAFYLPSTVFSRYSTVLELVSILSEHELWVFDSPPSIKTEITGLYSTNIRIRAVKEYDFMVRKTYKPGRIP